MYETSMEQISAISNFSISDDVRQDRTRARSMKRALTTRQNTWGGPRPGAGRPASGPRSSAPHKPRPALAARHPVHVTAYVVAAIGNLRAPRAASAIARALDTSL